MSETYKTLKNPPITEALFDIRTITPKDCDLNAIADFHNEIKDEFQKRQVISNQQASLKFEQGAEPVLATSQKQNGFLFKTQDGKKIIQMRLDGFTFNKLKPYDDWASFSDEAIKYWSRYVDIVKPTSVTRLALRYINRIEIPEGSPELKAYVNFLPDIPKKLSMSFYDFLIRTSLVDDEGGKISQANIIQTIDNKAITPDMTPYILDIDVFRQVNLQTNDEKITKVFNELHDLKNKIFFNLITVNTKKLFN